MRSSYAVALPNVLKLEGGKVNHPKDPGGRTNMGVTQRVYDGFRRNRNLPVRSVYDIERHEVEAIYRLQYWDKIRGDELPAGVDLVVFDGAVNSGPLQSVKWLQAALGGGVRIDGVLGEASLAAVKAHPDHDALVAAICAIRLRFLKALRTWSTFGRGWTARVMHVKDTGQALASGSVGPAPVYFLGGEAKGRVEDAKRVRGLGLADATSGAGAGTGIISQITDALAPAADAVPAIGKVVTVLTALGAAALVAGLLYRRWATARQAEIDADLLILPPSMPANDNMPSDAESEAA
jgi:lysozyme family protein